MQARLQIRVLGNPTILLDDKPATGWTSSKVVAMLYYLAVTGRSYPRDALISLLWDAVPAQQAQQSLRGALFNLRKVLDPFVNVTRQTVGLNPDVSLLLDIAQFEAAIQAARDAPPDVAYAHLEQAVGLYGGDFLEGFWIAQAPAFEEWKLSECERLRQLAQHALHMLTTYAIERGTYVEGIEYATRVLKMDPWQEEAQRQLMLLLALSGQRGAALAQYDICRRALQDELGVDPSDETTEIYRRILDGEIAAPTVEHGTTLPIRPLHNLPAPSTPFVGRETERTSITDLLRARSQRLLTLTGHGGIGKTRLALEAAQALVPTSQQVSPFAHGVFLVSLAAVAPREPIDDVLAAAIATDLHIPLSGPDAPRIQVLNYLREKFMLIVLDNFEHVVAGAGYVAQLLREAPQVSLLVTSRVRLNLRGERTIELEGLPFPAADVNRQDIDEISYEAVQLFVQTAEGVSPTFEMTPACALAVARICTLVQGLPLGLELAATWTRVLECAEIADEIARSMDFLASGMQDMPERHQSLRAVFNYSWNLLAPTEQQALRRLALFRAPFTREAALEVAGAALPMLGRLIDTSLVQRDHVATGGTRYELLDVLRQFAAEQLEVAGETATIARRYADHYLGLLHCYTGDLRGAAQRTALTTIAADIEHVRVAWDWAVEHEEVAGLRLAGPSLFHVYDMRSWFQEGLAAFGRARRMLATLPPSTEISTTYGMMLAREGWFTFHLGHQVAAQRLFEQSLEFLRAGDAPAELVFALNYLGAVCSYLGEYNATQMLCTESLALAQAEGNDYGRAIACNILAQAAYARHDHEGARRWSEQSLAIEQQLGNRWSMAYSLTNLGNVAYVTGAYEEARQLFEQSLEIREEMQDTRGVAICFNRLGDIAVGLNDLEQAQRRYEASLQLCREIGNRWGFAAALINLGQLAITERRDAEATQHFRQALQLAVETASLPQLAALFSAFAVLLRRNGEEAWADEIAHLRTDGVSDIESYEVAARRLLTWQPIAV